ncbi:MULTISPECIES: phosphoribosylaminoimidazolesuccinocarboxamide synthase [Peptoniphilus]|uniref:phosphoribosylaminoimidazolesuccinocarboxamide synthase n=1 Tax=Peptoniphilus lacrimalis TaxID=33031 RepID=A0A379C2J8_9FIRM|nr:MULTISPECIES: phosphoribosylaminoimidazolesuccinocarboxamide synthase [Peptoniphilus]EFK39456.1 putative phosphoribosylaminoimidazolesuccinocarboxamide synthase [Peptoniphilus sp. oral taxon 836 str. F0141]MDK7722249.1 phosphoribosylaminoimidazolesuccinocarboxamide synthase [Peptoniphilus lacrimalis]MDK7731851.1 phosphoribosylaminoimidazolesuccinocarboxamide synthase [Peptoniphilus lacrimalis]SUB56572.1 Phosphoribosylaminoimidazole-succinocarboxamide synthase [Peptoniphilus lacrimalis]
MEVTYRGKTKNLFQEDGKFFMQFKDDMTGTDGVFDTGGNQVAGSVAGAGHECIKVSKYFFERLKEEGIKTHYINADLEKNVMEVKKASVFGKGIEVITRFIAVGSFIRRYGSYIEEGKPLNNYTEITLKDDDRDDPLIIEDALVQLGILKEGEYDKICQMNIKISNIIKDILKEKGLDLYDIKLEYGRLAGSDEIVLIDEVSGGNMRAYKDGKYIKPLELSKYMGI